MIFYFQDTLGHSCTNFAPLNTGNFATEWKSSELTLLSLVLKKQPVYFHILHTRMLWCFHIKASDQETFFKNKWGH